MNKISISEALNRISKLKGRISQYQTRANQNVSRDASKKAKFDFKDQVRLLEESRAEMLDLETRVAVANATALVSYDNKQVPLAYLIRLAQEIKGEIAFYKALVILDDSEKKVETVFDAVSGTYVNRTVETVYVSEITEVSRESKIVALSDKFETINNLINRANYSVQI